MNWTLVILVLIWIAYVCLKPFLAGWRPTKAWSYFRKPKPRVQQECQSCQHFISCAMAGVTECPLMK